MNEHLNPSDSPRFQKFKEAVALFFTKNPITFNVKDNKNRNNFNIKSS